MSHDVKYSAKKSTIMIFRYATLKDVLSLNLS